MNQIRIKRLILLFVYVLVACVLVFFLRPVYLLSLICVLLPPALLNFFWLKNSRTKILLLTAAATLLFAPAVELSARLANAWDVQSVLPRFLGLVPLENMIFAGLNFLWVLSFYEYFINQDRQRGVAKKFVFLLLLFALWSVLVFSLFFLARDIISMPYFNLALLILIVPGILLFLWEPRLVKKCWLPTIFFAVIFFVYELVSLYIGSWWWPGDYLWSVIIWGKVFPVDDVVIWYILSTPVLIYGYEFFVDDGK